MSQSDPHSPGGMSVTIKADEPGGKYNDAKSPGAWVVFHGTPTAIKAQIIETFGFDQADSELGLSALIVNANTAFKALMNVSNKLGGRVLGSESSSGSSSSPAWEEARSGSPAAPAEEKAPPTLAEEIEACESVDSLKELWLDRSEEIKSADLVSAWQAKGAALKAAA